jgi:transcription elongation factor GreA
MTDDSATDAVRVEDAAHSYLASLKPAARQTAQPEVLKFVRWCSPDREIGALSGHEIAQYAEQFPPTVSDAARRADQVRSFLKWAHKEHLTGSNLGIHLRVKKVSRPSSAGAAQTVEAQPVYLTKEGHDDLVAELEALKARRPIIQADLARAMADKDFRENAPLDAARNEQGHLEARIRELEATLRRAVVLENGAEGPGDIADIGTQVTVRDLRNGQEKSFTLVNSDEVRSGQGKISIVAPLGRAIYQRRTGEEVDVEAPAGTFRVRIEGIRPPGS